MKRIGLIIISIISFLLIACIGVYYFGAYYYFNNGFCPNTYINDVNVSMKSYDTCDSVVKDMLVIHPLVIDDNDGSQIVINGEDIYHYDEGEAEEAVKKILETEDSRLWFYYLFNNHVYSYEPVLYLDEEALAEKIDESGLPRKERFNESNKAEIVYSDENGFEFIDNTKDLLDWDLCKEVIYNASENETGYVNLVDEGVYKSLEEQANYQELVDEWEKLNKTIDFNMVYHLATGEDITVDSSVISKFIMTDEEGNVMFDENDEAMIDSEAVLAYVQDLSDKYDNMYTDKKFKTTRGDVVTIPYTRYTTYGSLINVKAEAEELENFVREHNEPAEREPIYVKKEDHGTYANNYGGTYVEVDITGQHMYYYKDNELVFDTDVVTGCKANGNMTPNCVCYIVNKARNVTLIGPGYESFVYYWMCITGQIGIHDATWRRTFGGEIYLYGGSHGCVNTPIDKMSELFQIIEIGTPVIVHQ